MTEYAKGLHQVADRVWVWLAPDGSWGWSNAGIIEGDGASFVHTLFDLPLTAEMLAAMSEVTDRSPITARSTPTPTAITATATSSWPPE